LILSDQLVPVDRMCVEVEMQMPPASRALAANKDFFNLWKDADRDIPILKQAKAEYAKLQ
jgi:hypothetical protein